MQLMAAIILARLTDSTRDRVGIVALKNASAPMNASPAPCSKFTKHFEKKKTTTTKCNRATRKIYLYKTG